MQRPDQPASVASHDQTVPSDLDLTQDLDDGHFTPTSAKQTPADADINHIREEADAIWQRVSEVQS